MAILLILRAIDYNEHFSIGLSQNANYTVNIIENWIGDGKNNDGLMDKGIALQRKKRETHWMLKLRTVYPYGLNERVDYVENVLSNSEIIVNSNKIVGKLFPSINKKFNTYNTARHSNVKKHSKLNFELFTKQ